MLLLNSTLKKPSNSKALYASKHCFAALCIPCALQVVFLCGKHTALYLYLQDHFNWNKDSIRYRIAPMYRAWFPP